MIVNNTIITKTFFRSVAENFAYGLSADWACEVGAKTKGNIPGTDRKNSYYCIFCPEMFRTYQGKIKLFEFSRIGKSWP